ncbi:MAG: glycosyltransferase family 4 protein [Candidatus Omnitrophica bacterium]|nr:glycosyltransferase family 4 protein [Candidatus Omnitrophota bacterium]
MKILILTNHFNCGGITSYILNLSRGLAGRGNNIYVASSGGDSAGRLEDLRIPHFTIPIRTKCEVSPRVLAAALKLAGYARDNGIDIIHSHTRVTQVLGCLLSRLSGLPHLSTCHGFFRRRLSRMVFPCWGMRVIAISEAVKEHLTGDLGVTPQKVRVVYNGVDVKAFSDVNNTQTAGIKGRFGLKDGPVIGIIARLSDVKGHMYLIEAMPQVLSELPEAQLFIVGEGRERGRLDKIISKLGLKEKTVIMPSVANTSEVLAAMDVFVMPSLQEGLGLALMEAMAAGLPIAASNIGGIPALIKNAETGLLVEPKDTAGLARAITFLLKNRDEAYLMAHKARDFVRENFSLEKMARETENVYKECVSYAKP